LARHEINAESSGGGNGALERADNFSTPSGLESGGRSGGPSMDLSHIRRCEHCQTLYDWRRSASSSLKMTYCGSLCEKAALGFTIETLLRHVASPRPDWRPLLAA